MGLLFVEIRAAALLAVRPPLVDTGLPPVGFLLLLIFTARRVLGLDVRYADSYGFTDFHVISLVSSFLILSDLASFDHNVARCLDGDLPASVERDVLALEGDGSVLLHRDAGAARLNRNLIADVDD